MKLLALDGNSILNRAFYGIKLLSTKKGAFTNGIYGFLTMLNKLLAETEPDAVAIAFDLPAKTFRHKAFDGYKAKRKGMPEELAQQLPELQALLTELGFCIVTCEGYEADDILGTLSASCEQSGDTCIIATGDRDSLQLISPATTVRLTTTKFGGPQVTLYDEAKILSDYGVKPKQLIDIKAIQGDQSDNIPGVAGIGEKGAGELIRRFGSLSEIYDNLDTLEIKPGVRTKLEQSKDQAMLSYMLGEICTTAPIETDLKRYCRQDGDPAAAQARMAKLELFSLMDKFGLNDIAPKAAELEPLALMPVTHLEDGCSLLARTEDAKQAFFYTVYDSAGNPIQMVFAVPGKKGGLFSFAPTESFLLAFLSHEGIEKYTHDTKPLHKVALRLGLNKALAVKMDTLLAAYLLNPSSAGYDVINLARQYGVNTEGYDDDALRCAAAMPAISSALSEEIKQNSQEKLLDEMEIPLAAVLAQMEYIGFSVDRTGIAEYGEQLQRRIDLLSAAIIDQVGYAFNINSPKQLGEALFDKLGLPHGKKTKSGWSTNVDVLEDLRPLHPVVEDILNYRTLTKLKSTYCDGLLKVIGSDGRIHSSFNQAETRTGRISSTEPNLQNIPVRTDVGRELRRFFTAENGVLVDADYSQIELRVLAHVAKDSAMIEDFLENRDIHTMTASRVFNLPLEFVTTEMRRRAKAVNFGIVYGIGAFSLAKDIGVTRKEADDYIKEYLVQYAGVDRYMKQTVEKAKETGYVETIFGRRRYLPELKSSNFATRSFGERVARNMPIQGTAADIIKIAMIKVSSRLIQENLKARLILQVHDELIVECPEEEKTRVSLILTEEMESAVSLSVPMRADASSGKTWYDAKE